MELIKSKETISQRCITTETGASIKVVTSRCLKHFDNDTDSSEIKWTYVSGKIAKKKLPQQFKILKDSYFKLFFKQAITHTIFIPDSTNSINFVYKERTINIAIKKRSDQLCLSISISTTTSRKIARFAFMESVIDNMKYQLDQHVIDFIQG